MLKILYFVLCLFFLLCNCKLCLVVEFKKITKLKTSRIFTNISMNRTDIAPVGSLSNLGVSFSSEM